jgi:8-oxo-dGTP pyrophosphatase MutT (NUDIX family)
MWIAKRSQTKPTYPGMLDNFAAGGLTAGLKPLECAIKEVNEETGLSPQITKQFIKPVDTVSYAYEEKGKLNHDGEFVFDLKIPHDFVPIGADGEVEEFFLMSIPQVSYG